MHILPVSLATSKQNSIHNPSSQSVSFPEKNRSRKHEPETTTDVVRLADGPRIWYVTTAERGPFELVLSFPNLTPREHDHVLLVVGLCNETRDV